MTLLRRLTFLAALAVTHLGCATTPRPTQADHAPAADVPEAAAGICAVRSPCAAVAPPTAEEVGLCEAVFGDLEAPCRAENAALFVCSLRAARCSAEGEIDEDASLAALEAHCLAAQADFETCCEAAEDSVHCELLRQEAEEPGEAPAGDAQPDSAGPGAATPPAGVPPLPAAPEAPAEEPTSI